MFNPDAKGPPLHVAIIRSSSIGDVVLASASIRLLLSLELPLKIFWLGKEPSLGLLKEAYPGLQTIPLKSGTSAQEVVEALAEAHFLVDLQGNLRSRMIRRSFSKRYGRPTYIWKKGSLARRLLVWEAYVFGRRRQLPERAFRPTLLKYQSMVQTVVEAVHNQLPAELHLDAQRIEAARPFLPTGHEVKKAPWQKELQFGRWLALAPGASFFSKRTPLPVLVNILHSLRRQYNQRLGEGAPALGLLFLGDASDRVIANELIDLLGWHDPVINLAGRLNLWENALALKEVAGLLSNDSSLGHIAEAVGKPACVLFGATAEAFGFAPHLPQSQAFSVPLGCRPCSVHGQAACRFGDYKCFYDLPTEKVAEKLLSYLLIS